MKIKSDPIVNNVFFKKIKTALRKKYKPTFNEIFSLLITKITEKLQEKNIDPKEKKKLELLLVKIYKETTSK